MHSAQTATSGHRDLGCHAIRCVIGAWLARSNAKRVFRETQTNPGFDAVGKLVPIQLVQRLARRTHVIKLNETHGPILFIAEAEALVPPLFGKEGLQLLFRRVRRQIANVKGIAGRIHVVRVGSGEAMASLVRMRVRVRMRVAQIVGHRLLREGTGRVGHSHMDRGARIVIGQGW